ncbi:MAG: hypothetical protein ACTHKN_13835 [Achromobacter mucicolens]
MKSAGAALIAVLLIGLRTSEAAPLCDQIVQVGAWNIEWLGNAKDGKRKAQKSEDIAAYIGIAEVDVLALAEISPTSRNASGEYQNDTLDAAFEQLNQSGAAWKYTLLPKRPGARAYYDQWTGVAWNERRVQKVGGPWRLRATIDSDREKAIKAKFSTRQPDTIIWSRWPHAFKFSAGKGLSDFIVVPVHFKANSGRDAGPVDARKYEVDLLLEALDRGASQVSDGDLVVLGDSNMLSANEPAAAALRAYGMKDCNAGDIGTHLSSGAVGQDAPFDRVFLVSSQPETQASCPLNGEIADPFTFTVVRPSAWLPGMGRGEFRDRLSDHQLVRVGICAIKDDD